MLLSVAAQIPYKFNGIFFNLSFIEMRKTELDAVNSTWPKHLYNGPHPSLKTQNLKLKTSFSLLP
jgi:hypothetical protein